MAVQVKMTAAEYLELPETMKPMMLLDGEVTELPSPTLGHQRLLLKLYTLILRLVPNGELLIAPLDVLLDQWTVVQPDLLWIAENSPTCAIVEGRVRGAPDFVAEVLSAGTARYDRKVKFELYERYGTREYWLVDPTDQYIEVWVRAGDRFQRLGVFAPDEIIPSPLFGNVSATAIFEAE